MLLNICRCDNAGCISELKLKPHVTLPDGWIRMSVEGPKGAADAELCSVACAEAWARRQIATSQEPQPEVA